MKVSREQAAENRSRVVDTAARLFRERGFSGIGVADLMKDAGLTHGGFYGQFGSKEVLLDEACARAFEVSAQDWEKLLAQSPTDPLATVVDSYLSTRHRDLPGRGCAIAALGADVARQSPAARHGLTEGVRTMLGKLAGLMPGRSNAAKREKALAAYASMVGALVLARAVDDPELSEDFLRATAASLRGA